MNNIDWGWSTYHAELILYIFRIKSNQREREYFQSQWFTVIHLTSWLCSLISPFMSNRWDITLHASVEVISKTLPVSDNILWYFLGTENAEIIALFYCCEKCYRLTIAII